MAKAVREETTLRELVMNDQYAEQRLIEAVVRQACADYYDVMSVINGDCDIEKKAKAQSAKYLLERFFLKNVPNGENYIRLISGGQRPKEVIDTRLREV